MFCWRNIFPSILDSTHVLRALDVILLQARGASDEASAAITELNDILNNTLAVQANNSYSIAMAATLLLVCDVDSRLTLVSVLAFLLQTMLCTTPVLSHLFPQTTLGASASAVEAAALSVEAVFQGMGANST